MAVLAGGDAEYAADEGRRTPGTLLLPAIVTMPVLFSWFTLRRGYSTASRVGALGYAAASLIAFAAAPMLLPTTGEGERKARAGSAYVVPDGPYLMTTPEEAAKELARGDRDFEGRAIVIQGTVAGMKPSQGHTAITLKGASGGTVQVNGDYLDGLEVGREALTVCPRIARTGAARTLKGCGSAPPDKLPLHGSADMKYSPAMAIRIGMSDADGDVRPDPEDDAAQPARRRTTAEDGRAADERGSTDGAIRSGMTDWETTAPPRTGRTSEGAGGVVDNPFTTSR